MLPTMRSVRPSYSLAAHLCRLRNMHGQSDSKQSMRLHTPSSEVAQTEEEARIPVERNTLPSLIEVEVYAASRELIHVKQGENNVDETSDGVALRRHKCCQIGDI